METPLVSICSITYNHAPFIRQCLDGFLMQQCNFSIEIIINDDCSTDGTTEIIREYAEKYPDKIFPVFHEENLWSKGERGIFQKFVFPKARGKYIALCEGDDYWTDPRKLQKQVDFLESHPDYSMCCHAATIKTPTSEYVKTHNSYEDCDLSTKDIFLKGGDYITTSSICFHSALLNGFSEFSDGCPVGDYPLQMWCAMNGRVCHFKDVMSIYRSNHVGSWSANMSVNDTAAAEVWKALYTWMESKASSHNCRFFKILAGKELLNRCLGVNDYDSLRWKLNVLRYLLEIKPSVALRVLLKVYILSYFSR